MAEGELLHHQADAACPFGASNGLVRRSKVEGAVRYPLVTAISQLSHTIRLLDSPEYETSGFRSKSWNEFAEAGEPKFDFVFTLAALPHAANKADSDRHLPIS